MTQVAERALTDPAAAAMIAGAIHSTAKSLVPTSPQRILRSKAASGTA